MSILSILPDPQPSQGLTSVQAPQTIGQQLKSMLFYLTRTEVHTYAFSVAANAILSLFPFIVLLLTVTDHVFHSPNMERVIGDLLRNLLPTGQDFVIRNMVLLVHAQRKVAIFSLIMLLISSSGIFLPLEIALNHVWNVRVNRSYLRNQIVSLGLAFAAGLLALLSVAFSAAQRTLLGAIFFGHTHNFVFRFLTQSVLQILASASSIGIFFLIYWLLPNRKTAAVSVLPSAVITGLIWEGAKLLYIAALPRLDLPSVYGPFATSVGLMMWAFLSGLILLSGAHYTAMRVLANAPDAIVAATLAAEAERPAPSGEIA